MLHRGHARSRDAVGHMNIDNIMLGARLPARRHPVASGARRWSWKYLADVPDDEINKITHLNAMRHFQYDPFAHIAREDATVGALRQARRRTGTSASARRRDARAGGGASARLAIRQVPERSKLEVVRQWVVCWTACASSRCRCGRWCPPPVRSSRSGAPTSSRSRVRSGDPIRALVTRGDQARRAEVHVGDVEPGQARDRTRPDDARRSRHPARARRRRRRLPHQHPAAPAQEARHRPRDDPRRESRDRLRVGHRPRCAGSRRRQGWLRPDDVLGPRRRRRLDHPAGRRVVGMPAGAFGDSTEPAWRSRAASPAALVEEGPHRRRLHRRGCAVRDRRCGRCRCGSPALQLPASSEMPQHPARAPVQPAR